MRKMFYGIRALAGLVFNTACEEIAGEGWIVDWAPVDITIEAYDAAGNSIISPEMPGMTLTFMNETYEVRGEESMYDPIEPKYFMPRMYGLIAKSIKGDQGTLEKYILYFGQINGASDLDEDILLNWPDGSSDTIHYHCGNHREGRNPKCDRSWKLNGAKHSGSNFIFNGKSLPSE